MSRCWPWAFALPPPPPPQHAARTWNGVGGQLARGQHDVPEVEGGIVNRAELDTGAGGRGMAQWGADPADRGEVPPGENIDEGMLCVLLWLVWGQQEEGLSRGHLRPSSPTHPAAWRGAAGRLTVLQWEVAEGAPGPVPVDVHHQVPLQHLLQLRGAWVHLGDGGCAAEIGHQDAPVGSTSEGRPRNSRDPEGQGAGRRRGGGGAEAGGEHTAFLT